MRHLPKQPTLWTWEYDYDTYHLGAVTATIYDNDDIAGFEVPYGPGSEVMFNELIEEGCPADVVKHARLMYENGVKMGTLGKPHPPSWER
tara:strand:- start:591 stop:860 length:270 start_codon:yes stop_codon:yes gene_type:complete